VIDTNVDSIVIQIIQRRAEVVICIAQADAPLIWSRQVSEQVRGDCVNPVGWNAITGKDIPDIARRSRRRGRIADQLQCAVSIKRVWKSRPASVDPSTPFP
jgi:hypothetical protein